MARIRKPEAVDGPAHVAPGMGPRPNDERPGEAGFTDSVARRAFELFQTRGEIHGHDLDDWLEAERLVREEGRPRPVDLSMTRPTRAAQISLVQGAYYAGTGFWPLVSMKSFERVTGHKRDHWLVKTVGLLVTAVGLTLIRAGRRRHVHPDIALLAGLSAAALATVDLVYVAQRRISPVYLLDAVPEALLAAWWATAGSQARHGARSSSAGPRVDLRTDRQVVGDGAAVGLHTARHEG